MPKPKKLEIPQPKEYRGVALPITRVGGDYWASKKLLDLVWSSVILVLGTPKGTRIMLPEFGSDIISILWEPNDEVLRSMTKHFITDAIGKWEPRVQLLEVEATSNEHTLKVNMQFLVKNLTGVYGGGFTVFRSEGFKLVEQFWGPIS